MSSTTNIPSAALVVDDDPLQQSILGSYFTGIGTETIEFAANGRAALDKIGADPDAFDIVVTDLKMPEMDGLAFMRALKDRKFDGQLLVVSSASERLVQSAERISQLHGFRSTAVLCKPLNKDRLDKAMADLLRPEPQPANPTGELPADEVEALIRSGGVIAEYQPKIEVHSGRIVGVETLARLQSPNGKFYPNAFIDVAERNGLMEALTIEVVRLTLREMRAWAAVGCHVRTAFNISATSIRDTAFTDRLLKLIEEGGVVKSQLTCELTETSALEESAEVLESLTRIAINRIGISVDDFGTGFASMERLRDFAYTELKIDRSFAANGHHDSFADASVRASVMLGRNLGMRIVAEGIETREQWDYIVKAGVDEVQGFLTGRPMPADTFLAWYRSCGGRTYVDAA